MDVISVFRYGQIDTLLDEPATLLDQLAQLDQVTGRVRQISESIAQTYFNLKPKNEDMAQSLDRLCRLQEVLQSFVFAQNVDQFANDATRATATGEYAPPKQPLRREAPASEPSTVDPIAPFDGRTCPQGN